MRRREGDGTRPVTRLKAKVPAGPPLPKAANDLGEASGPNATMATTSTRTRARWAGQITADHAGRQVDQREQKVYSEEPVPRCGC